MREITVPLSPVVAAYIDLVVERCGLTPEQVVQEVLEGAARGVSSTPRTAADEERFRAALEQTLTKNAELYRRLARQ